MKVAAAIQSHLDDTRRIDLVVLDRMTRLRQRPRCNSCDLWRQDRDRAHADADRYAAQLRALGQRPMPLLDGNEATYSSGWRASA